MNIELDYDTVTEIIARELQNSIFLTMENPFDLYHDYGRAYALVDSMIETLEYYMVAEDFEDFVNTLPERIGIQDDDTIDTIEIIDLVENDDGSANITFNIPEEHIGKFASDGVLYALTKAALGNPTNEELFRWATRGKEEENN